MRAALGVAIMLALAMTGTMLWVGPVPYLWALTFAQPCPENAPASSCLVTLPATVDYRFDEYMEGNSQLALLIPDPPVDISTSYGHAHAFLTMADADRLGITGDDDEAVEVTLFDTGVVAVTGPNGQTAETWTPQLEAFLGLLGMAAAAILAIVTGGYLWRRLRGGQGGWIRRAAISTTVGAIAGVTAAGVAAGALGARWLMPTTFAVTALVSLALAFVPVPRAWSPIAAPDHWPDRPVHQ